MRPEADFDLGAFQAEVDEAVRDLQRVVEQRGEAGGLPFEGIAVAAIVGNAGVMSRLCPCLQHAGRSAQDIAAAITPVLAAQTPAGPSSLPRNALIYAAAALLISRLGVEVVCPSEEHRGGQ